MASRRFHDVVTDLSPESSPTNTPFVSCRSMSGTDSPIFQCPLSSPPDIEIMRSDDEDTVPTETSPLITHDQSEMSVPLLFPGSSNSFEPEVKPFWTYITIIRNVSKKIKPWFFFLLAVAFSVLFAIHDEIPETAKLLCLSQSFPEYIELNGTEDISVVTVVVSGPFIDEDVKSEPNLTIALVTRNGTTTSQASTAIGINCSSTSCQTLMDPITIKRRLNLAKNNNITHLMLALMSNTSFSIAISLKYYLEPVTQANQVIIAVVILVGVYILIIFEVVHRATAAMLGALAALSFLSYMNKRPPLETIITWVRWETLSLLFGMMILVAVFAKTGIFDYVALKAYKLSRGHVWGLITLLCTCTALISAVLDNVTLILLLTPVTVTLCQVLNLNPTPILIAEVIFSNIGGTATAIGDNVILISDKDLKRKPGIAFADLTKNVVVGIILCVVIAYGVLRLLYRNVKIVNDDPPIIEELKREAEIWKRSADRLPVVSAEEKTVKLLLIQKAMTLENIVRNMKRTTSRRSGEAFQRSVQELERKYVIRDKVLLMKSSFVIILVIVLFFVQSFTDDIYVGIGWIAVLGAILLILLADVAHIEDLMEQVEWATLVFYSGLFILMESLNELGLIDYLGEKTSDFIAENGGDNQLAVALIVIVLFSALVSSFIDNIPFMTAMIPVVLDLSQKNDIDLPPLIWALAMGTCLGGNGTLIGASANVVCAGLAEQYGYPITFIQFFKIGFPIMLVTTLTATAYLYISQVLLLK